ncbi:unnamed protein product, partial [Iphiclides podalirius]
MSRLMRADATLQTISLSRTDTDAPAPPGSICLIPGDGPEGRTSFLLSIKKNEITLLLTLKMNRKLTLGAGPNLVPDVSDIDLPIFWT